nr:hypothetical protein [uncultured Oribacterium sp.]
MKEEWEREGSQGEGWKKGDLRREDSRREEPQSEIKSLQIEEPQSEIKSLQIEELQRERRVLMQEMLLKHQESDGEVFRVWWEEEGREERYFSLQRRIEELEDAEWKRRILPYAYEEEVFHEV